MIRDNYISIIRSYLIESFLSIDKNISKKTAEIE